VARSTPITLSRLEETEYRINRGMLAFWDLSNQPETNDREKKLGRADPTRGAAFFDWDEEAQSGKIADGLTNRGSTITSIRHFEPDNFVLRLHTELGRGKDGVWALRNIVEHENLAAERGHRSTMWIDQCPDQHWAYSQDAFWIKKLSASVAHREVQFNGAGFLSMLLEKDKGTTFKLGGTLKFFGALFIPPIIVKGGVPVSQNPPSKQQATAAERAALMLNISKRGGYATDGKDCGQLWHVLHIGAGDTAATGLDTVNKIKITTGGAGGTGSFAGKT